MEPGELSSPCGFPTDPNLTGNLYCPLKDGTATHCKNMGAFQIIGSNSPAEQFHADSSSSCTLLDTSQEKKVKLIRVHDLEQLMLPCLILLFPRPNLFSQSAYLITAFSIIIHLQPINASKTPGSSQQSLRNYDALKTKNCSSPGRLAPLRHRYYLIFTSPVITPTFCMNTEKALVLEV